MTNLNHMDKHFETLDDFLAPTSFTLTITAGNTNGTLRTTTPLTTGFTAAWLPVVG